MCRDPGPCIHWITHKHHFLIIGDAIAIGISGLVPVFDIGEHRAPQVTPPVSVKIVKLSGPSEVTQGKLHFGTTRRRKGSRFRYAPSAALRRAWAQRGAFTDKDLHHRDDPFTKRSDAVDNAFVEIAGLGSLGGRYNGQEFTFFFGGGPLDERVERVS